MSLIPLSDLQNLNPEAIIELFKLDLSSLGGSVYYFHAGTNKLNQDLTWQSQIYVRFPIKVTGFETSGAGTLPRPTMEVSNILSAITAIVMLYDDLIGAVLTRKRTLKKYLDAVNFVGGVNASADPTSYYPDDVFIIERKITESRKQISFELVSKIDIQGKQLPNRQIIQNSCPWVYKGSECGYAGTSYFNKQDVSVQAVGSDICAKRLSSCKARFGENAVLPFGGFPGAGLTGS